MYLKYYNLNKELLHGTASPEFLFRSSSHKGAIATILHRVEPATGEGYSKPVIETEAEALTQKLTSKFEGDASTHAKDTYPVKRIVKKGGILYSPVQEIYGTFYKKLTGEVKKQNQRIGKDNKIPTGERLIFPEPAKKARSLEDHE